MTVHRSTTALLLLSLLALSSLPTHAEIRRTTHPPKETTLMTTQNATALLAALIPLTHQEISRRAVRVDKDAAQLTRYERKDGRNAGIDGEHFSTVIAIASKYYRT